MSLDRDRWKADLSEVSGASPVETDVPLGPHTTFRIGGVADLLIRAKTATQLTQVLCQARSSGISTFLLGRGANILVSDEGFRGLVVKNEVGGVDFLDATRVRAGSGVLMYPDLIRETAARGLGGLHHFVGIPSTVGGAIWQNLHFLSPAPARSRTVFIAESVQEADVLSASGQRATVPAAYFQFGYDYSILHDRPDTVLTVTFRLAEQPAADLDRVMRENLDWRSKRHPDLEQLPSAGSIFKKVEGVGAGRLIDQCGLKGRRIGGAQIYPRHANIIVNLGGARASDVLALMDLAQETVLRETGIELVPEISLVGEF